MECSSKIISKPIECCNSTVLSDYKIKEKFIFKDGVKYAKILESRKKSYESEIYVKAKIIIDNKKGQIIYLTFHQK